MDYQPLNLEMYCNAGVECYEEENVTKGGSNLFPRASQPPVGAQVFRGIPFQIGRDNSASNCYIALGTSPGFSNEPVEISVGRKAFYIVFAHALLETRLWRGGELGLDAATYSFIFGDGGRVDVPIRERFEIGHIPLPWGQHPFLCVPDSEAQLAPRSEGAWEMTGWRQTEALEPVPEAYFLWAWRNPSPEKAIDWIRLVSSSGKVVVAGITLGHEDEYPFARKARRPVKITLLRKENADEPFSLNVGVDRGVTTYPYPLPRVRLDKASAGMSGFGSPPAAKSSPAFVEISATPSATVTIKQGDSDLGRFRWGDLEARGSIETAAARVEVIGDGKNWVRTTVVDDQTGERLPCRIAFHSEEGIPYAPHGHHSPIFSNMGTWHIDVGGDVRLGQIAYAYIDGMCEGWLPRGKVLVDVARGFEYEPLRTWITIEPGQQRLTLRLRPSVGMNERRWYSGDTHVHFLSSAGAHMEADAEGLNVVNLLQSQWGHLFTSTEEFTGEPSLSSNGRTIVYVNQENRQHMLGHLTLLGLKSPIMPWCSGGAGEAEMGGGLEVTLARWADACHEQGGTVIIPHFPSPNCEAAVLVATGRADAVEMIQFLDYEHREYYRYLNGGYRLPLVGGTDKMDSWTPVGLYRTYVHIPPDEPFTYSSWCNGIRAGRTFLSGGAMISLTVEGQPIGSTIEVSPGATVEASASAWSIFPLHTLQIVEKGSVVAETSDAKGSRELSLTSRLKVGGDSWLVARCSGPGYRPKPHFDQRMRGIMAHTSPIYLTCGSGSKHMDEAVGRYMLTLLEGGLSYIRQLSPQEDPLTTTHHHGGDDHQRYLEEPFHEAREEILRRLHAGMPLERHPGE